MANNDKRGRKAKRNSPISPLLAGIGIGFAWAALHAPGSQPPTYDLLVWLLRATAAGVLAAAACLVGLAAVGYVVGGVRLLGQKLGSR